MSVLYGIGVGAGDPELLTLKAIHCLEKSDVITAPRTGGATTVALDIVQDYIQDKEIILFDIPMTREKDKRDQAYQMANETIQALLDEGKNVAFVTLGDISLYSTFMNIQVKNASVVWVSGISAMSAMAATLQSSLAEQEESLHVVPVINKEAIADVIHYLQKGDNVIVMKFASLFSSLYQALLEYGFAQQAQMIACCGMENEQIFFEITDADTVDSYFSTMLIKGREA